MNYQEIIGDHREFDTPKPQSGNRRLYRVLFGIQIVSVLIVTWCSLYAAGYFG